MFAEPGIEGFTAKVGVIGDDNVGRGQLMIRFAKNKFNRVPPQADNFLEGIYEQKIIDINGKKIYMKMHSNRYKSRSQNIYDMFFQDLTGVIICYAINNVKSFHNIVNWMRIIDEKTSNMRRLQQIPKIIVATKSDTVDRCVSYEDGKCLADKYGVKFFETSAKEDKYVEEIFYELAFQMIQNKERKIAIIAESKKEIDIRKYKSQDESKSSRCY